MHRDRWAHFHLMNEKLLRKGSDFIPCICCVSYFVIFYDSQFMQNLIDSTNVIFFDIFLAGSFSPAVLWRSYPWEEAAGKVDSTGTKSSSSEAGRILSWSPGGAGNRVQTKTVCATEKPCGIRLPFGLGPTETWHIYQPGIEQYSVSILGIFFIQS